MSALLELAERCEAAAGPDRELDASVSAALGVIDDLRDYEHPTRLLGKPYFRVSRDGLRVELGTVVDGVKHRVASRLPRPFTASLDAAMMLVPEGAHCGMGQDGGPEGKGWAWVRCKVGDQWQEFSCEPRFVANMTLALCAAALRARAILEGD